MSVAAAIDAAGVAVVTGGASGFGLTTATRLVKQGMRVALLDVSAAELAAAESALRTLAAGEVLAVRCDVTKLADCTAAREAVAARFPGVPVSFLFNNAGISGPGNSGVIVEGGMDSWRPIFDVNVFGAVHILKAFVPAMVAAGPLPSGKRALVVTTSSVVGLLNHNIGPYSVSKMAVTAVCEQFAIELEDMGAKAAHISPHSLHPTIGGTGFLESRGADGKKNSDGMFKQMSLKVGITTADQLVDGMMSGLDAGKHYIIVDHPSDVPTAKQVAARADDTVTGRRPRRAEQLGVIKKLRALFEQAEKQKAAAAKL